MVCRLCCQYCVVGDYILLSKSVEWGLKPVFDWRNWCGYFSEIGASILLFEVYDSSKEVYLFGLNKHLTEIE